jgi:hypothetical protein
MAVIAEDGYFPALLAQRHDHIPTVAILTMASFAFLLVLAGNLRVILEFGSVTFLLVSLLMAYANFRIRHLTGSSTWIPILSLFALALGTVLIVYYQATTHIEQLYFIVGLYGVLTASAWLYARSRHPAET